MRPGVGTRKEGDGQRRVPAWREREAGNLRDEHGFASFVPGSDTPPMFRRKPDLPPDLHTAWWSFVDCAEVIEAGRRVLLGTLPTGRVEPAPIGVGTDAIRRSIADARAWMPAWRLEALEEDWRGCVDALDTAERALQEVDEVAATTDELEELLTILQDVIDPLDTFADAEREWRRRWRLPRERTDV